jgi:UDP-3-O-[3-hydroxymyristoyl] glucosamine N-acyltransferase
VVYSGYPAMENLAWRKSVAVFKQLPELQKEMSDLREVVSKLTERR